MIPHIGIQMVYVIALFYVYIHNVYFFNILFFNKKQLLLKPQRVIRT